MSVSARDPGGTGRAAGILDAKGRVLARGAVPTLGKEGLERVFGRIVGPRRDFMLHPVLRDVPSDAGLKRIHSGRHACMSGAEHLTCEHAELFLHLRPAERPAEG